MVSLKDIAEACGVSTSTVSKALNDFNDISAKRKEIIRKKAKEMGYLPNMAARALKTNVTHNIGVLFVDDFRSGLTHPFFAQVLEGFKIETERRGYDLTFINHKVGEERVSYYEHCRYRNVDGVVIACVDFEQDEILELVQSNIPAVTIDHVFNNCSSIRSDNTEGMRQLTEYAIDMGHRRIAFIHGQNSSVTRSREVGFYKALEAHGIRVPDSYIREAPYQDGAACAEVTRELLALPVRPTCIFYPDDYACIGGISAIHEAGLAIPEDISVAGYDGIPLIQQMYPRLTTFGQDMSEIGRAAAEQLVDLIEKPKTTVEGIRVVTGRIIPGMTVKEINPQQAGKKEVI